MEYKEVKDNPRIIALGKEINGEIAEKIVKKIVDINAQDADDEKKVVDFKRIPILLLINSPGGNLRDGFAIMGAIELSKTPVHAIAFGTCASMALIILQVAHKRSATKYTTLLYHCLSHSPWGQIEELKRNMEESERLQAMVEKTILDHSAITKGMLTEVRERVKDWWIPAQEALQLKLIDEIITAFPL
jgi:ATP-dependent Clp endopeptidase proteolytic subunit ClpP